MVYPLEWIIYSVTLVYVRKSHFEWPLFSIYRLGEQKCQNQRSKSLFGTMSRESVVSLLFFISFSWCVDTCNLQQNILKSPRGNLYSDPASLSNCGFCMEQFRRSQGEVWNVTLLKILTLPPAYYCELSGRLRCMVTPLYSDQVCHIIPGRITGWRHCRHI